MMRKTSQGMIWKILKNKKFKFPSRKMSLERTKLSKISSRFRKALLQRRIATAPIKMSLWMILRKSTNQLTMSTLTFRINTTRSRNNRRLKRYAEESFSDSLTPRLKMIKEAMSDQPLPKRHLRSKTKKSRISLMFKCN